MAVRPDLPWHWRAARIAAVIVLVAAAVAWAYMNGSIRESDADQALARLRIEVEQQTSDLAELRAKLAQSERAPKAPEEKFFVELKSRTVHAYYTSEIGIHKEMEYKGNTLLQEYVGTDVSSQSGSLR